MITKVYVATLDNAFVKWLLKILVIMMAGLLAQLISTGCSTRCPPTTHLAI